jgi:hypothetical protein
MVQGQLIVDDLSALNRSGSGAESSRSGGAWKMKLASELQASGYRIDRTALLK